MTQATYSTLKKADFDGQIVAALAGILIMRQSDAAGGLKPGFIFLYLTVGGWQALSLPFWLFVRVSGHRRSGARQLYYILLGALLLICSSGDVTTSLTILFVGTGFLAVYYFLLTAWEAFRSKKRDASSDASRFERDSTS